MVLFLSLPRFDYGGRDLLSLAAISFFVTHPVAQHFFLAVRSLSPPLFLVMGWEVALPPFFFFRFVIQISEEKWFHPFFPQPAEEAYDR